MIGGGHVTFAVAVGHCRRVYRKLDDDSVATALRRARGFVAAKIKPAGCYWWDDETGNG